MKLDPRTGAIDPLVTKLENVRTADYGEGLAAQRLLVIAGDPSVKGVAWLGPIRIVCEPRTPRHRVDAGRVVFAQIQRCAHCLAALVSRAKSFRSRPAGQAAAMCP